MNCLKTKRTIKTKSKPVNYSLCPKLSFHMFNFHKFNVSFGKKNQLFYPIKLNPPFIHQFSFLFLTLAKTLRS